MYLPKQFCQKNQEVILRTVRNYPFATIVSTYQDEITTSRAPLIVKVGDRLSFEGHLAKPNDHWRSLDKVGKATLLFYGPDAYISPSWYPDKKAVPTWNYVAIQFQTTVTCINDRDWLLRHLKELVEHHERIWKFDDYKEYVKELLPAVVGLRFSVQDIQAKFKLSQHRSIDEKVSVIKNLKQQIANSFADLAAYMDEAIEKK